MAAMGATKRRRLMVNLDPEVAPLVEQRARMLNRSVSNYIETLITAALAADGKLQEPAAPYLTQGIHGPKEKPPDNAGRTTGAGPRHRVSKSA